MYHARVRPRQSAASSSGALPAIRGPSNEDGYHLTRIGHTEMPPAAPPVQPRSKPRPPQGKAHALTVAPILDSHDGLSHHLPVDLCGVGLHYVCRRKMSNGLYCSNDRCTKEVRQAENGVLQMHAGAHGCQECESREGFRDNRNREWLDKHECGMTLTTVCRCGNDR